MKAPRHRVFVSSVMVGYEEYREAAREGIRQSACDPVMAEDFAAQGVSARNACLDGVESADVFVLLLGPRYGWVAPSGLSVTEEEYDAARSRHLPILVFVHDGVSREPRQQRFVDTVEDYIKGHFRKSFRSLNDLRRFVKEAVMAADLGGLPRSRSGAAARIREALARRPAETRYSVWMKTVWTTLRDEEVVDPLTLNDREFEERVLQLGHGCTPPLFSYKQSKQSDATVSRLRIVQGELQASMASEDATVLTIHRDGTLTTVQNVTGREAYSDPTHSLVTMHRLDPDVVQDRLERAWSFAAAWWNIRDRPRRHDLHLYDVGFYYVGHRTFERPAEHKTGRGLPIPPECPHNPLIVFDPPRQVSRSDFAAPEAGITRTIKMLALRFREWANNPW